MTGTDAYSVVDHGGSLYEVVRPDGESYVVKIKKIRYGCVRPDGTECPSLKFKGYPCKHIKLVLDMVKAKGTGSLKKPWPMDEIAPIADEAAEALSHFGACVVAGSIRRRMKETAGDIDLVLVSNDLRQIDEVGWQKVSGGKNSSTFLYRDVQVNVKATKPEAFGAALMHYTGSKNFNIMCRARAMGLGLKLNEFGLWNREKCIAAATEQRIFDVLGMSYRNPAAREM